MRTRVYGCAGDQKARCQQHHDYERRPEPPDRSAPPDGVHAAGEAFADQPGDDQHHAVDAEREHEGEHRLAGEILHAVPGGISARERQDEGRTTEQRELPVGEDGLL